MIETNIENIERNFHIRKLYCVFQKMKAKEVDGIPMSKEDLNLLKLLESHPAIESNMMRLSKLYTMDKFPGEDLDQ